MNKHKALFLALNLSLGCGILANSSVAAIDEVVNGEITVSGDEDPINTETSDVYHEENNEDEEGGEAVTTSETDETQPVAEEDCDNSTDENCQTNPERYDTEFENALEEGLANEPEVICATGNEEGCDTASDSEMWPLYISLGALGATVILVIIINLIGRKKK